MGRVLFWVIDPWDTGVLFSENVQLHTLGSGSLAVELSEGKCPLLRGGTDQKGGSELSQALCSGLIVFRLHVLE